MTKPRILIIEDDAPTAEAITAKITHAGFEPIIARTGEEGWRTFQEGTPDLIILDLMLPDTDGTDLCRRIRQTSQVPIIMVTARAEETARIVGLELGADDYVTKPFSPKELVSRVKSVLRRTSHALAPQFPEVRVYQGGGLVLDEDRHEVLCDGEPIRLTPIEYKMLRLLLRNAGVVVSRETIIQEIWGYDGFSDNLVEIHIGNLRRKIEADPRQPKRLATVRAFGYKIMLDAAPN
jgi:DNA-binding response OmpR family regulator